jgi:hypothetical protein
VNAECVAAGVGHTSVQVATKFANLLQTHHETAYIPLLIDLARAGSTANIKDLWYMAQITANALAKNTPRIQQHVGQSASTPPANFTRQSRPVPTAPCDWCDGPHLEEECFRKDFTNIHRYPLPNWPGGIPPDYIVAKYNKNFPKNTNKNPMRGNSSAIPPSIRSIHHLQIYPESSDPHYVEKNVYRNVKNHSAASEWINKDILTQKWQAINKCTDPEETYSELLRVNAECVAAGVGNTSAQVATKFAYLLQTHHETAYIPLLIDLARAGSTANITDLWYMAQIIANALAKNTPRIQ